MYLSYTTVENYKIYRFDINFGAKNRICFRY